MGYAIEFRPAATRAFEELPARDKIRISRTIDRLRANPFLPGCKKLEGTNYWRVRAGNYRVVYAIQQAETIPQSELVIIIIRIGHRREVYRHL